MIKTNVLHRHASACKRLIPFLVAAQFSNSYLYLEPQISQVPCWLFTKMIVNETSNIELSVSEALLKMGMMELWLTKESSLIIEDTL